MPLDDIVQVPRRSNSAFDPRYSKAREIQAKQGGRRTVRAALPYWFPIVVPFTSQAGQNLTAVFNGKNFDLEMRAAWTDLVTARLQLSDTSYGLIWSNDKVPITVVAGRTNKTHPLLYLRKPYLLLANSILRADLIDDAGTEVAGQIIWACVRPDTEVGVQVEASREWYWAVDLGLTGGTGNTNRVTTRPVNEDVLIYGAMSTSTGSLIRIIDDHTNIGWSDDKLPVGAFAGIEGQISPIVWYPQPMYVPRNTSMIIEWQNAGAETGKFFTFVCERILRSGSTPDNPTQVTPMPRTTPTSPPSVGVLPPPTTTGPSQQPGPSYDVPAGSPLAVVVVPAGQRLSDGTIAPQDMIIEKWSDGSSTIRARQPWE